MANKDPDMFLSIHKSPLIIDEVQYAPGLLDSIEAVVDKEKYDTGRNEGMYILAGSQVYNFMDDVTQSMAGRISIIEMSPLSLNEILKSYINNSEEAGFFHYRDSQMNEIDLILLRVGKLTLVEWKSGITYDSSDIKAFDRLEKSDYKVGPFCLICLTENAYPIRDGVYALPITSIRLTI
jgi:predicted AAA+ superfamily ATPase